MGAGDFAVSAPVSPFGARHIILSDFAGEQIARAQSAREEIYSREMVGYKQELVRLNDALNERIDQARIAWKSSQYFKWLKLRLSIMFFRSIHWIERPVRLDADQDEQKWTFGKQGEEQVIQTLFSVMPQDWVVVSGYHSRAGEADILIVAPNGLMVLEVKNIGGEIACNGNHWASRKRNKEIRRLQDRGGRSPGQQASAVADRIGNLFARVAPGLDVGRVRRGVVFAAPTSIIRRCENVDVNLICTTRNLTPALMEKLFPPRERPLNVPMVLERITMDHNVFARQLAKSPKRSPARKTAQDPALAEC